MKWDIDKFVVVVHGNIRIDPSIIENAWKGFNIIWSTWKDQDISTENKVIYNEYPSERGVQNLGYQRVSLWNGLLAAKELGYERAIKWRTDQYPTDAKKFVSLFNNESVNVLFWHSHMFGYYVDYLMEGKIEDLMSIWNFETYNYVYSEYATTGQIIHNKVKINCIGSNLTEDNDIVWMNRSPDIRISSYNKDQSYQTMNIN